MNKSQELLFELLHICTGSQQTLCGVYSEDDWERAYAMAEEQSVTGVLLPALDIIQRDNTASHPPRLLLLQWIGLGRIIEQRNHDVDKQCQRLLTNLATAGLHPTILKGQGIAKYYPDALQKYRHSGDIDVYVSDGREKAVEYAKSIGQKKIEWDYKHLHLDIWHETEIELHYHAEILQNPFKNRELQHWFKKNERLFYCENGGLITPTIEMNLFYVLLHIYRHFFAEGVGLRQLMDYYFVLVTAQGRAPQYAGGLSLEDVLNKFGMWRFAQGIMWIMQEIFGLNGDLMFCQPSEEEGRFILEHVLAGGNFGHNNHIQIKGLGKFNTLISVAKHNNQMARRYPSEALMSPLWYLWHKLWKITRR